MKRNLLIAFILVAIIGLGILLLMEDPITGVSTAVKDGTVVDMDDPEFVQQVGAKMAELTMDPSMVNAIVDDAYSSGREVQDQMAYQAIVELEKLGYQVRYFPEQFDDIWVFSSSAGAFVA